MPSMPHDGPVELVRQCPDIAVDFARAAGIKLPPGVTTSLAPTDMSAAVPVQYLADMVVLVHGEKTTKPLLAVVIEPQLRDRETKRYSWPVYVATARRVSKCPRAVLVVLCPDPAEARKCRKVIRTGHPGYDLAPVVIDSSGPPGAGHGKGATGAYLTVFAASMGAIDTATESGAQMTLDAIRATGANDADLRRMTRVILSVVSEAARRNLETMMKTTEYKKTLIDVVYEDGEAKGKAKGEAKGKAEDLLELLDGRGLAPSAKQRARVTACTDIAQLNTWFRRAITAATADEVFAE